MRTQGSCVLGRFGLKLLAPRSPRGEHSGWGGDSKGTALGECRDGREALFCAAELGEGRRGEGERWEDREGRE